MSNLPMDRDHLTDSIRKVVSAGWKEAVPFETVAVLLFGSRAEEREKAGSDVDLLVVARGINPKRHRRGKEIASIKRSFRDLSLDVLLLTEEEVISNFKNHNPLFLDIAGNGIIISDEKEFLRILVSETRQYIREKGIQRFGDGWIFPVRKGSPVYLSKVSNRDFCQAMLRDGRRDCEIGKKLTEDSYFDKAVYHFQQSVEKSSKSILIAMGIFQKTHLVGRILRDALSREECPEQWKSELSEAAGISEEIEPEVSLSRYPGIVDDTLWLPFEEYTREDAQEAMKKAARVLSIAERFVDDWFEGGGQE